MKKLAYLLELRELELEFWDAFLHAHGQDKWEYGEAYETMAIARTELQKQLNVCCI